MIDRLFKSGLLTTILAFCIYITAVVAWFTGRVEASEVVIIAGVATPLLFLKDKNIGVK